MGSGVLLVLWPPDREKNIFGGLPPGGLLEASGLSRAAGWEITISAALPLRVGAVFQVVVHFLDCVWLSDPVSLAVSGSDQAYRTISIGQLNALLRLHLRPIDVVVYHGPQGYRVLRGASRLDAFSGYPVRS